MDFDLLAYAMLGLSLLVSAVKVGNWTLNADPRAIINAGRWSLLAVTALAVALLVWLVMSGRYNFAMMLAAFMLPVLVQAAPRWRLFIGPLGGVRFPPIQPDLSGNSAAGPAGAVRSPPVDPDVVRECIAVLRAYVEQNGLQIEHKPAEQPRSSGAARASGNGKLTMSFEEALEVLGLEATASAREVNEAHERLIQKLDPRRGGSFYLIRKIDEAKNCPPSALMRQESTLFPSLTQRRSGGLLDDFIRECEHRGRDSRGQEPWQSRAAIRMSHLGNSFSKCDPSQSCPSPRLGHACSVLSGTVPRSRGQ